MRSAASRVIGSARQPPRFGHDLAVANLDQPAPGEEGQHSVRPRDGASFRLTDSAAREPPRVPYEYRFADRDVGRVVLSLGGMDSWWVLYEHGWLRVIDEHVAADLDHVAGRLAEAARSSR
jgi:hypothetical protein